MFDTLFFKPLYNSLVWLIDVLPGHSAGGAVIILTLVVSLLLFSISKKAIKTQIALKEIEPELQRIKTEVKNKEDQARQTLALYQKNKVNPFSMIMLMIIQFPILIALYYVFFRGLPIIKTEYLYSFVASPENVNMIFLSVLDLSKRSVFLAILAGVTQFIQALIIAHYNKTPKKEGAKTMQEEFAHSMQLQMNYFLPAIIAFIGLGLPAALTLYWSVRNIFTSVQELFVRKGSK